MRGLRKNSGSLANFKSLLLRRDTNKFITCPDGRDIVARHERGERFRVIFMDQQMCFMHGKEARIGPCPSSGRQCGAPF